MNSATEPAQASTSVAPKDVIEETNGPTATVAPAICPQRRPAHHAAFQRRPAERYTRQDGMFCAGSVEVRMKV